MFDRRFVLLGASIALAVSSGHAADRQPQGLFDAMDAGAVAVEFIPLDASEANVLIENRTNQVIHLQLPDAFAAVPVLGQLGMGVGMGAGQQGGGQAGGGGQTVGGNAAGGGNGIGMGQGFGNPGGGGKAPGMGVGFMRIAPGKTCKVVAQTVCLEHGKPEPRPRMEYRMIPIEQFSSDPQLAQMCSQVGTENLSPAAAQALAWHLANDLSWDELAKLNRIESKYRGTIKFFTVSDLDEAQRWLKTNAPASGESEGTGVLRGTSLGSGIR